MKSKFLNLVFIVGVLFSILPLQIILAQNEPESFPEEDNFLQVTHEDEETEDENQMEGDPYTEDIAPEIKDNQDLRAEFVQYTQNPRTKEVTFELVLKSNINSERVTLTWEVGGVSIPVEGQDLKGILRIQKGKEYRLPITVVPTTQGISEVFGTVEVTNIDNRSFVTVRKNFASNAEGEVLPITDAYKQKKVQQQVFNIILFAVILVLILLFGFFGLRFFLRWLDRDEVKAFEQSYNEGINNQTNVR